MFLTKGTIKGLVDTEGLIRQWEEEGLQQWSYDLRLGGEVFLSSEKDLTALGEGGSISIQPGEFALLVTKEELKMPTRIAGFISLKFTYALKGLVNISGFHVDPGFEGKIVFSVYNAGPNPVVMRQGDPVFMIIFATLDGDAGERPKWATFRQTKRLKSDWISSVKGPAVSLTRLNTEVERLRNLVNLLVAFTVALLGTIIGALVLGVRP